MQKIKTILKLLVSVGGLIFVFSRVPFSDISKNWNLSVLPWLIPMLILTELGMLIQANRWKKMSIEGPEIPYRSYYAYIALGYFFNNLLPGGFGGDVVKSVAFGKRYGQTSQSVASILISRILGLLALFVCFFCAIPFLSLQKAIPSVYHVTMICMCGLCIAATVLCLFSDKFHLDIISKRVPFVAKLQNSLAIYRKHKGVLFFAVMDSIWLQLITIATNCLYFMAIGHPVSWAAVTVFSGIIIIVSMIPISINGIGIREGVQISLYTGLLGIPADIVLSAGLLGYILLLFQVCQGAVVFAIQKKHSKAG